MISGKENSIVTETYLNKKILQKRRQLGKWGCINFFSAILLILDSEIGILRAFFEINDSGIFSYVEFTIIFLLLFNCAFYLARYVGIFSCSNVSLSSQQKHLLGVTKNEPGFVDNTSSKPSSSPRIGNIVSPSTFSNISPGYVSKTSPIRTDTILTSPQSVNSLYASSASAGNSPLGEMPSSFLSLNKPLNVGNISPSASASGSFLGNVCHERTSTHMPHSPSMNNSALNNSNLGLHSHSPWFRESNSDNSSLRSRFLNESRKSSPLKSDEFMKDMKHYSQFLQEFDEKDQKESMLESPRNGQSFWSFNRNIADHSPILQKYTYQIACKSPQSTGKKRDEVEDGHPTYEADEIWQRAEIKQEAVDVWTERLRKWLGMTIMSRLSKEIKLINRRLCNIGCEDMEIGEVSISVLKQLAFSKAQHLPSLHCVLPFLELSENQHYLVQRVHLLGADSCLADFSWRSGCEFKGEPWSEHLPTDAALVLHVFCCYMDSRLPPHPKYPDGKTFSSQYVLKTPDKPNLNKTDNLLLYQACVNPPHFKVVIGKDMWNIPKGRNNLFHALLLFLHHVDTKQQGMLGKVNLGMSGINILNVVQHQPSP